MNVVVLSIAKNSVGENVVEKNDIVEGNVEKSIAV